MYDATPTLTIDDLLAYRICPAWCWIARNEAERVPPAPEPARRRGDDVRRVLTVARSRYPDGVTIEAADLETAVRATARAVAGGGRTLYGASVLSSDGLQAHADVLVRDGDGWELIVIDASTSPGTEGRLDAVFREEAFTRAGYAITRVTLLHLNKHYRRNGHVDPELLFTPDSALPEWRDANRAGLLANIHAARRVLAAADCPPCECDRTTRGRRCPAFALLHPDFPSGGTVYDLVSINQKRLSEALDLGVRRIVDWPDELKLSPRQWWQVEATRTGRERIQRESLRDFIEDVRYPCYFLDYETFQTPVPLFSGTWPYQQVPFQYSLHVLYEDGELEHLDFLWVEAGRSPLPPLVESLRDHIGDEGSVLVWWKGFEGTRNRELAEAVPERSAFLHGLNGRMVDLMEPISRGLWVHPAFAGSTSIKKVLPVVAPELDYSRLEIGHGALAMVRWKQCVVDDTPPPGIDPATELDHLRDYCRHDTLGMVRIWHHLCELAGVGAPTRSLAGAAT